MKSQTLVPIGLLGRVANFGTWVGGICLLLASVLIAIDLAMRKFLGWSMGGADEIAGYVLAMANPPVQRTADLRKVEVKVLRKGITVRARQGIQGRD